MSHSWQRLPPPAISIRPRVWFVLLLIGAASWAPIVIAVGKLF